MTLEQRVYKLERLAKDRKARAAALFIQENWSIGELIALVKTWPDYPQHLKEKLAATNFGESKHDDINADCLVEAVNRNINFLREVGVDVDNCIQKIKSLIY